MISPLSPKVHPDETDVPAGVPGRPALPDRRHVQCDGDPPRRRLRILRLGGRHRRCVLLVFYKGVRLCCMRATWNSSLCIKIDLPLFVYPFHCQLSLSPPLTPYPRSLRFPFTPVHSLSYTHTHTHTTAASKTAMFTHRESTALDGGAFFARVTFRVIYGGLSPREAIEAVAAERSTSSFIRGKVKQVRRGREATGRVCMCVCVCVCALHVLCVVDRCCRTSTPLTLLLSLSSSLSPPLSLSPPFSLLLSLLLSL